MQQKASISQGHILVVDDNRINRMMLDRALRDRKHRVTMAEDGQRALELLEDTSNTFDVVLLDVMMPEMDGYELLEKIKGNPALRHLPVIMVSALDQMKSVVRCIEMGATDYLTKPFNTALLEARLDASLVQKRLRDLEIEYLEQVEYVVKAAESVESSTYDPASLDHVAARDDALGQLARVFQQMAKEVHLREQRLIQQLNQLQLDMEEMRKAETEPAYVYLPIDRRYALTQGEDIPDRGWGTVLFADISGFTPLTTALAKDMGGDRGAEELTRLLNRVYSSLIDQVHFFHGSVIGFSGDAITCWFDDAEGISALGSSFGMLSAMEKFEHVRISSGESFSIDIKVAIVQGGVRRFLVGDPEIQRIDTIAGSTLDRLAQAEGLAKRGELVVDESLAEVVKDQVEIVERRFPPDNGQSFAVLRNISLSVPPKPWPDFVNTGLREEEFRSWLLQPVFNQLQSDSKMLMAGLRDVAVLFLNFSGIDYDAEDASEKLDQFIRWVQKTIEIYEGFLIQVTLGDKGSYLYMCFGALLAHKDDAHRAVLAAFDLQHPPERLHYIRNIQIGVTHGNMRTGAYGGGNRRTFGVLGDKVNLAARLMTYAHDAILCDRSVYVLLKHQFEFETLTPIQVKGKAAPIQVYRPVGKTLVLEMEDLDFSAMDFGVIKAQFDRLSPLEQVVLKVASIIGMTFDLTIMANLFKDRKSEEVRSIVLGLAKKGFIQEVEKNRRFTFRDLVLQELAYDSMLYSQRRYYHRLIAEELERQLSQVEGDHWYFANLAVHWKQADNPAKAMDYYERAGNQARQTNDLEAAQGYFEASLVLEEEAAVLSQDYNHQGVVAHAGGNPGKGSGGPDYAGAIQYALDRLRAELAPELAYHNFFHTKEDVIPAVLRLAELTGVSEEEKRLLEVGAAFHDIGFVVRMQEHEREGAKIAGEVLPDFGFASEQVELVQGLIMATRLPQTPRTPLEELMADADLDVFGREDFLPRNLALREELANHGTTFTDKQWLQSQAKFIESHRYFSQAARNLREEKKGANLEALKALLAGE